MPTSYLNKESIANQSLLKLGGNGIVSFDDETLEANLVKQTYATKIQHYLSMSDWHFAIKKQQLSQLTETPVNKWTYLYQLPSDMIKEIRYYNSSNKSISSTINFERAEKRKVYSDETELYLDYLYYVDESYWPHWFVSFVVVAYAADIAYALTRDQSLEDSLLVKAFGPLQDNLTGGLFGDALKNNSQTTPAASFKLTHLTQSRFAF